jgi:aryl-alcohol dehydrogenase-like predicted oxidoreductase
MQKRKLGYSDLEFSTVGFGSWAAGGPDWKAGWGPQDDNESIAAIRRAIECGVNWIDTAAVYGLGHSETVVGQALQGIKERVLIATKCGRRQQPGGDLYGDLRPEFVREECESSLRRLKIERIDLYQIHWPQPDEQIEGAWTEIKKLIEQGKVRYAGVSNFSISQMERAQKIHPIASTQPPYNMLRREIEVDVLPFCKKHNIGVLCYSPMQNGLLTGKFSIDRMASLPANDFRRTAARFQEPELSITLNTVEKLKIVAARLSITCSQLAIAWTLRRPEVTSAIVGVRKPSQIEETARAGDVVIPPDALSEIEAILQEHAKHLAQK